MPTNNDKNFLALKSADIQKNSFNPIHGYVVNPQATMLKTTKFLAMSTFMVVFPHNQEPKRLGRGYKDIHGAFWYLPELEIDLADGAGLPEGAKAVQFLRDTDGSVSLRVQLALKKPDNMREDARVLIPTIESSVLVWNDGLFDLPTPSYFNENGTSGYRFLLPVPGDKLDALVAGMKDLQSGMCIKINSSLKYQVQKKPETSPGTTSSGGRGGATLHTIPIPLTRTHVLAHTVMPTQPAATSRTFTLAQPLKMFRALPAETTARALETVRTDKMAVEKFKLNPELIKKLKDKEKGEDVAANETVERSKHLDQKIMFGFTGQADNEQHIFAALQTGPVDAHEFADRWQHTEFGTFAPASFPNRIYMMPHALRLRYNPDTLLPDISPVLYMDEEDEPRVRLRLMVTPWYDLEKVAGLRDFLTIANPSAFMYPELITNFSARVSLKINTQFSEGVTSLNDIQDAQINFASVLSLDLDVTLEFYKFVTSLLEGPVGIAGTMTVFLNEQDEHSADDEDADDSTNVLENIESVTVPFSLRLKDIANPQLRFTAPEDDSEENPARVLVRNEGGHDLSFSSALPHLLYRDMNSPVPLNMFRTTLKQPLPVSIAAGDQVELEINLKPELESSLWNSIDMVLAGYQMEIDPKDALRQTHDLVPPGGMSWDLTIQVPPFMMDSLPAGMERVFAVNVMIEREGKAPMTLTLTPDSPEQTVKFSPSLSEIIEMEGGVDFLEYSYKTQTILNDRMMDWTASVSGQGGRIFVFPTLPPADSDTDPT